MNRRARQIMAVLLAAVIIAAGSLTMVTAHAAETMKTTAAVNMRREKSASSEKILTIPKGATVTVYNRTTSSWYEVAYGGKNGFVSSAYLTTGSSGGGSSSGGSSSTTTTKKVIEDLNMRSSKSLANKKNIILVIPKNGTVTILSKESDNWYKVKYSGKTGYIKGGHFTDDQSRKGKMAPGSGSSSSSSSGTKKMAEDLKMRSSKSTTANNVVQVIPKNATVTILSAESDNWYKVKYNGKTGYIKGGHFTDDKSRLGVGATAHITKTIKEDLNLRSSMSKASKSNIITVIPKNGKVTILENGPDNWYKVDYNGTVGYIKGGHFK